MTGRENEPRKKETRLPFLGYRARAMGSSGWEAYTVGFVLVGSIVACSALGWWLDSRFKTSFWLPVLFFVGVAAGFREMFVTLNRINREEQNRREQKASQTVQQAAPPPVITEPEARRERIFRVPPPPEPAGSAGKQSGQAAETENIESVDDLIERLLAEADDDDSQAKDRKTDV